MPGFEDSGVETRESNKTILKDPHLSAQGQKYARMKADREFLGLGSNEDLEDLKARLWHQAMDLLHHKGTVYLHKIPREGGGYDLKVE